MNEQIDCLLLDHGVGDCDNRIKQTINQTKNFMLKLTWKICTKIRQEDANLKVQKFLLKNE